MFNRLLDRLEACIGRHNGIPNLMTIIIVGMAATFIADLFLPAVTGQYMSSLLMFDKAAILRGQIWRVLTFVFIPPNSSIIFIIFSLMFYWMLGNSLQAEWGSFRFTAYYVCGMIGSVIAGTITGYATSYYINMSLFLAVAIIAPDMELNLYGILPVKMKWMAVIYLIPIVLDLVSGGWPQRIAVIVSLLNVLLFFYGNMETRIRNAWRHYQWKKGWRKGWK